MANYRVPVLEQFSWQPPVMSGSLTAPPGSPVKGDRYIVADPATGDWLGQEDKIATYTGSGWLFDAPVNNWVVFVDDAEKALRYDGSATHWVDLTTAPRSHHSTHEFSGSDAIKLDALDTPEDTTTLDATTERHGLLPKLGGGTTNFLRADGTWAAAPGDMLKSTYDTDGDSIVDKAEALNDGTNNVSAAQAKEAYDRRGSYDAGYKCLMFEI